jgi:pyruvate kinase
MVTLPSEAARDAALVRALIDAGMDIARINAAHDDVDTWTRMAKAVREAAAAAGRDCRIALDLAGPKLRTGPIEPGHAVLRLRPRRDELGRTIEPARVALVPAARTPPADPSALPVTPRLVRRARIDDTLELVDARGRARRLRVVRAEAGNVICATDRSTYLVPGTVLLHRHGKRPVGEGEVGAMMPRPGEIALAPGDRLDLVPGERTGHAGRIDLHGRRIEAPTVSCGVVEVFGHLRPGHRVLFDDGTIGAVVREVAPDRAVLEVVHCAGGAAKLRAQKGINLPDTALDLPALTDDDRAAIAFAARHADLVSASFVQRPEDVAALCAALAAHGVPERPIALKIETASAFARLPELLFAALRHPGGAAVMVARGDLAVEVGFERLAEVQEEILWLAEAAHLPVIWATQVLEGFARGGLPSRAEVTDAAMGVRAECVMLNKGPYVVETVDFLSGVLVRMRAHQDKKSTMLRRLAVSAFD